MTSTNWPATKCRPGSQRRRGLPVIATRNSASLLFGSTLATTKLPRSAFGDVLGFAACPNRVQRDVTVLVLRAIAEDLALRHRSTVTGTCSPASVETRVIHTFCAIAPEGIGDSFFLGASARSLISTSTPAARSSLVAHQQSAACGSTMSRRRLCVRISNCSRLFLSTCGERLTVNSRYVRQRNRSTHLRTRALGRLDGVARRRIEDAMIERLEPDPDILAVHFFLFSSSPGCAAIHACRKKSSDARSLRRHDNESFLTR